MQWFKNWWYQDQYYKITKEGEQKNIYDECSFEYILHMHKTEKAMYYHFIKPGDSYQIKHPYSVIGLSITLNNFWYVLPAASFLIQGNELGETFMLWLCKHYLYRSPAYGQWTVIDNQVNVYEGKTIHVNNELKNDIK
jgi:hypothetical protein